MIELYTSEGCSSCPPAERYLNRFSENNQLWQKYIPLAFHVDYWDYLGWQDRFADARHTTRQKRLAAVNAARTIYTPGFFVNGRSWRRGFFTSLPSPGESAVGNLQVQYNSGKIVARYQPVTKLKQALELHVAVLGMGFATRIRAGENEGRHARHEFVVLGQHVLNGSEQQWSGKLPDLILGDASRYALVAWLSLAGQPAPLQATGGFIKLPAKSR